MRRGRWANRALMVAGFGSEHLNFALARGGDGPWHEMPQMLIDIAARLGFGSIRSMLQARNRALLRREPIPGPFRRPNIQLSSEDDARRKFADAL